MRPSPANKDTKNDFTLSFSLPFPSLPLLLPSLPLPSLPSLSPLPLPSPPRSILHLSLSCGLDTSLTSQFGNEVECLSPLKWHFFNHRLKLVAEVPHSHQATHGCYVITELGLWDVVQPRYNSKPCQARQHVTVISSPTLLCVVLYHHYPLDTSPAFSSTSLPPPDGHGTALIHNRHTWINVHVIIA